MIKRYFKDFRFQWRANYRNNGGITALLRCLAGLRCYLTPKRLTNFDSGKIEILTFSVIPPLTGLWLEYAKSAIGHLTSKIVIGDCSGSFKPFTCSKDLKIVPIYNLSHGEKLDLFIRKVCSDPYVIICDDDVFWLSKEPLEWAISQMRNDPSIASVSLIPRGQFTNKVDGVGYPLMGTYCLVLRREVWLRENLSFKVFHSSSEHSFSSYDTADRANQILFEKGYKVLYAPQALQANFVRFEATSSWPLKLRASHNEISKVLKRDILLQEKVLRVLLSVKGLASLIKSNYPHEKSNFMDPKVLSSSIAELEQRMPVRSVTESIEEVDRLLDRLRTSQTTDIKI